MSKARVTAVVVAAGCDASYLSVTLPHVLGRADFAERLVVIDPRPRRPAGDLDLVRQIVGDAHADGSVDRVVELDASEAAQRIVVDRYFESGTVGTIDPTVHAALFALDAAAHDLVAWFEPTVMVHTSGEDWLAASVTALQREPRTLVATTRGGLPATPLELPMRMLRRLVPERQSTTSGRHLVCDRRRLYGSLRRMRGGARPFGAQLTEALERREGFVEIVHSAWHVAPSSTAPPFAQWAEPLVRAVERGDIPSQRGAVIRLEDAATRGAWRHHLFPAGEPTPVAPPVNRSATIVERGGERGTVPLAIVIPIRDRGGADVRNSLASLVWQRAGRPAEIILVSHGSSPACEAELAALAREVGATLINVGSPADPWSKPLALNTGIRATHPTTPFVMTMDGDMILADNMFDAILAETHANPRTLVLCQSSDLPQGTEIPTDTAALRAAFDALRARTTTRPMYGTGGIQVLPRSFLFDVRGYDEDMLYWGALDTDMVRRAERAGLRVTWISNETCMLHQWHPRKHRVLDTPDRVHAARGAWLRNHEIMLERAEDIVRNRAAWGAPLG